MPAISTLALLMATADPTVLERATDWRTEQTENYCRLSAEFGKERTIARFTWYEPGGAIDFALIGDRARKNGAYSRLKLDFGSGPIETVATTARINYRPVLLAGSIRMNPPGAETYTSTLEISVDDRKPFRLALGPLAAPMVSVGSCLGNLTKSWGYDPQVVTTLSRAPRPLERPDRWLTDIDYPEGAVHFRAGGVVRFRLDVDEQGKVAGCNILFRTKPDDFADITCEAMRRRAAFAPALDASGKPVRAFFVSSAEFRIAR